MTEEKLQIQKKHIVILAIALIVVIGSAFFVFSSETNSTSKVTNTNKENINNEALRIVELSLPGMSCAGCAQSALTGLKNMNGVVSADVSLNTKKGSVIYDSSQLTAEQLVNNGIIQSYTGSIISNKEYNGE